MLRVLLVVAVMAAGCGPEQCTVPPGGAICDADQWSGLPSKGTGTRLWQCTADGQATYTLCANGCTAQGGSNDACN